MKDITYFIGILEDSAALRDSIKDYLEIYGNFKVLISAGGIEKYTNYFEPDNIDFFFVDEHLEKGSGIEALIAIRNRYPSCKCVFMTGDSNPQLLVKALENGACGFLYKPFSTSEIAKAIEGIIENGSYMLPNTTTKLLIMLNKSKDETEKKLGRLTKKEKEVARFLATGNSYKQIAAEMNISYHAVNFHVKNIYTKFSINSQAELVYFLNSMKSEL